MLKIENIHTCSMDQLKFIIQGMRNPMNSWDLSDTEKTIGENDLKLMRKLSASGKDHRKFMRMMPVYMRITAPLYWWKEFDTYKVGVAPNPTDIESNSCSTMHKITEKEFTLEDFSIEHLNTDVIENPFNAIIDCLNFFRDLYLQHKDKDDWWQIIQLLPSSYNQTRNVMLNYEVLHNIYHARKNHKLDEWHTFCKTVEQLELFDTLICN